MLLECDGVSLRHVHTRPHQVVTVVELQLGSPMLSSRIRNVGSRLSSSHTLSSLWPLWNKETIIRISDSSAWLPELYVHHRLQWSTWAQRIMIIMIISGVCWTTVRHIPKTLTHIQSTVFFRFNPTVLCYRIPLASYSTTTRRRLFSTDLRTSWRVPTRSE